MEDTIYFKQPDTEPAESLACKLGVEGNIKFLHQKGFWITAEDNEADRIEVWVAERPRTAVIEVTEPQYKASSRFISILGC